MDISNSIGKGGTPSLINNPFAKKHFTRVYVSFQKSAFDESFTSYGVIEFQNNNTKGSQEFKGETFDEVVGKIKNFIDNEFENK